MPDYGIFVGFGTPVRGREAKSLEVFNEALQWYAQLEQEGTIESFEAVFLEPHGGDLGGFILLSQLHAAANPSLGHDVFP